MDNKKRQKYYDRLVRFGMPEVIAASMAAQADEWGLSAPSSNLRESICRFQIWQYTKEGHYFWSLLNQSLLDKL